MMANITFNQWKTWRQAGYTSLPLIQEYVLTSADRQLVPSWELAWEQASPYSFVLESGKEGRYTYFGLQPVSVVQGKDNEASIRDFSEPSSSSPSNHYTTVTGKPLDVVREWMRPYRAPRLTDVPKWTGGCIGFWSYDVIRSIERLPKLAADDLALPDYLFMRMNELWIIDHQLHRLYCAVHTDVEATATDEQLATQFAAATAQLPQMWQTWQTIVSDSAAVDDSSATSTTHRGQQLRQQRTDWLQHESLHIDVEAMSAITSPFAKNDYMAATERIREYIAAGDVFQVNLSQRQTLRTDAEPAELYEWLRLFNPSPYMGFLRCPDFQLVSASPELLVEQIAGKLATRPIAGTRRRGRTAEEDEQMANELRHSEKERAEHIMLVDLERNDLGRVCEYGTVRVDELMVIEYYSHVMHLVSQVEGQLAQGKDAYDVIAATFPGGTITGAPKIRTMEIIEELEPTRRGPYTGSLGWIDYNGDMEFNIIIRTMVVQNGYVHVQAGAGIVIDSIPEREYYESLNKAKALWKAVQYSEQFALRNQHVQEHK